MTVAKGTKFNGRSDDMTFGWLTSEHGSQWESWRILMADWLSTQHSGTNQRMKALIFFAMRYLPKVPDGHDPHCLFQAHRQKYLPNLTELLAETMSQVYAARLQNAIVDFIDHVIAKNFSEPDDNGRLLPVAGNPFTKASKSGLSTKESVHCPLAYAYIKEVREILCPNPFGCFKDWRWAHQQTGRERSNGTFPGHGGDWFEVDQAVLDHTDPDCVYRSRIVLRKIKGRGAYKKIQIHELWSPVRWVALLIKLHLPLRTYQVRLLDSGEADTWRYQQGKWLINEKHNFSNGSEKNPWNRGVFCRINSTDFCETMTGFYINTNKTADQNKQEHERGYTIPWQNEEVLHWLEKLRNWQEKYNPISEPMPCTKLGRSHLSITKSEKQKREMGSICFLLRDAAAKGIERHKPVGATLIYKVWYQLLSELEDRVAAREQTLSDGSRLRFVKEYPADYTNTKLATQFPLHSLRVSLLTCYAMEGQVPMPVLSKLLAGHSRLLMTLYYIKPTPAMMSDAMDAATLKVDAAQAEGLRIFLRDAELRQIICTTAFRHEGSLETALENRNPVGWEHRHIGLCLVGGNTTKSEEMGTVGGCWNGGEYIRSQGASGFQYGPVPNGPENCVRCRWFVTDARYLDALRAHFNIISYKASLAANLAVEHEQVRDKLLELRYQAIELNVPFMQQHELQHAERRYERQISLADQYAKDLVACFQLIGRLIAIEKGRSDHDNSTKLVAVGSMQDIQHPISFIETHLEMLQLAQICQDAEIYPDLADDLLKTPAIEKRSRALNSMLMQHGYSPVFMQMDESMQLIAGNAMMRAMAYRASPLDQLEGFNYISGALEAGQLLKLIPDGIKAIENVYQHQVIKLAELIKSSNKIHGDLVHD